MTLSKRRSTAAHSAGNALASCPPPSLMVSIGIFIATFLVTRQIQIPVLNGSAAPWAVLMVIAWLRWSSALLWLTPILVYGALSVCASFLVGNDGANAIRFFIITLATLLAFHVKPARISAPIALFPLAVQSALLVAISLWLGFSQDLALAASVRAFILDTTWGDIYSFDGIYYRVQLIGNALVPLLFLISLYRHKESRFYRLMMMLSLLSIVAAGNLTYSLAAGLAIGIRYWRLALSNATARAVTLLLICIAIAFSWSAANEVLDRKFEGTDSSMGIRFDQIDTAINLWRELPASLVFGTGLGSGFPDGKERNYSQFQYIELQSLYLLVQLGLLGMLIYFGTLVAYTRRFLNSDGRRIFWLYVFSGCTNPTILDTNQIIAAVLLVCLFPRTASASSRSSAETSIADLPVLKRSRAARAAG